MPKYNLIGELNIDPATMPKEWIEKTYSVSTQGGQGKVWEVIKSSKETIHTVSSETHKSSQARNGFVFHFKKHYVLTEKGYEEIRGMLIERSL